MSKYVQNLKTGDEVVVRWTGSLIIFNTTYEKGLVTNVTKTGRIVVELSQKTVTFSPDGVGRGNQNNYEIVDLLNEDEVKSYKNYIDSEENRCKINEINKFLDSLTSRRDTYISDKQKDLVNKILSDIQEYKKQLLDTKE